MGRRLNFVRWMLLLSTLQQVTVATNSFTSHIWRRQTSCLPNEYGDNCTYCTAKDSCIDGHYSCDFKTGHKVCLPGWTGDSCRIKIEPDMTFVSCPDNQCRNGGSCISGLCCCVEGFTGILCEIEIIECTNTSCQNEGICKDLIGRYECLCKNGYTGPQCEIPPNSTSIETTPHGDTICQPDTCLNNGTCFEDAFFTYCLCTTWFTGSRCETSLRKMSPIPNNTCPENHYGELCDKVCVATDSCDGGHYICDGATGNRLCQSGWKGERCDTRILPQTLDPYCPTGLGCKNDGQCDKGRCCCRNNYSGELCQIQSIGCISSPCINNSTCIEDTGTFRCECTPGYSGKYCELTQSFLNPDNSVTLSLMYVEKGSLAGLTSPSAESSYGWSENLATGTVSLTTGLLVNTIAPSSLFQFENSAVLLQASIPDSTSEARGTTPTEVTYRDLTSALSSVTDTTTPVASYGIDMTDVVYTGSPSEDILEPSSFSSYTYTGNMLSMWSSFNGYHSDTYSFDRSNYRSGVTDMYLDFTNDQSESQIESLSTTMTSVPITTPNPMSSDKSAVKSVSEYVADLRTSHLEYSYNTVDPFKSTRASKPVASVELSKNIHLLSTDTSNIDNSFELSDVSSYIVQSSIRKSSSVSSALTTAEKFTFSGTRDSLQYYGQSSNSFLLNESPLAIYGSQALIFTSSVYSLFEQMTGNPFESVSTAWKQLYMTQPLQLFSSGNSFGTSTETPGNVISLSDLLITSQSADISQVLSQFTSTSLNFSSSYTDYISYDLAQTPSLFMISNNGIHSAVYQQGSSATENSSGFNTKYFDGYSTSNSTPQFLPLGSPLRDSTPSITFTDSASPYLLPVSSFSASQTSSISIPQKLNTYSSISQYNSDISEASISEMRTTFQPSRQYGYSNLEQSLSKDDINNANIPSSSSMKTTQPDIAGTDASLITIIREMMSSMVTTSTITSGVTAQPLILPTKSLPRDHSSSFVSSTYPVKAPTRSDQADESLVWWIILIIVLVVVLIGLAVVILSIAVIRKRRSDFRSIEQNPDAIVAFDKEHFSVQPDISNPTYEPDDDSDDDSVKRDIYIVNR